MRSYWPLLGVAVVSAMGGCMMAPAALTNEIAHPLLFVVLVGLAVAASSLLYQAHRHRLLSRGMARLAREGSLAGEPVGMVTGLASPLVAGIRHPRIYCGDDLGDRLDADELRAVILHERHHRLERAPLRLVVLAALSPALGRIRAGRAWLEQERARVEIVADLSALRAGVSREALAGALLKLSPSVDPSLAPGFATATELRIRALVGEPLGFDPLRSQWLAFAGFAVLFGACFLAYII